MYLRTTDAIAHAFGISKRAVKDWIAYADFPKRTQRGWNKRKVDEWCKAHMAGPYRVRRNHKALDDASARLANERAENERIKKERALLEQARELGQILLRDDVDKILAEQRSIVLAEIEGFTDAIEADLKGAPRPARSRAQKRCRTLHSRIFDALKARLPQVRKKDQR
jgi:hypothetical protein